MRFIHVSDLHIGKRVNEFSMTEDQRHVLLQIVKAVKDRRADAVFIAGDVYDKTVPSAEAVEVFDDFIFSLSQTGAAVFIISGNHDSPERLAFLNRLVNKSGVYISPVYNGRCEPIELNDEFGKVNVYLLPFIKPSAVKRFFGEDIKTYTQAVAECVSEMNIDLSERNVILSHQFVTGAERTESEELSVGGLDNVDASVYYPFDYVALGHVHRPQKIEREYIRYSGTPLKYSFSEANDNKTMVFGELKKKGDLTLEFIPFSPVHDMSEIKGSYEQLVSRKFYEDQPFKDDYLHITLTDENDVLNAASNLRVIYKNMMKLDYDNARSRSVLSVDGLAKIEEKSPIDMFSELFRIQNGSELTDEQRELLLELIEDIWGNEDAAD